MNRNTVAKAYAELESQGVIETIPGKGCFLKENNSPFNKAARNKICSTEIDEAVVTAHHLQVDRDNFLELVQERLDYFERKSQVSQKPNNQRIAMNLDTSDHRNRKPHRRYGKPDAVNGLTLNVRAGPMLRLFWPQRRGQNHHHQMPAEFVAARLRQRAGVWPGPAAATKWPSNRAWLMCRIWWRFIPG